MLFIKLMVGIFFSKIDLSYTYLQIPFEDVISKLECINTHRRLYKFNCLPFGVKVTTAISQQVMDTMLSGLYFVVAYLHEILIKSKSIIGHKGHVHKVFSKIQDYGFKLKGTNCDFSCKKSNNWVTLLIRKVEDQILNELLQLKTCRFIAEFPGTS